MYKQIMEKLSARHASALNSSINMVFFDLDGCLWNSLGLLPKSKELINKLKENGKKVFFVTNDNIRVREEILQKFLKHGFNVKMDEILSSSYLAAVYVKNIVKLDEKKKVYLIGSKGIGDELDLLGIQHFGIGPSVVGEGIDAYGSVAPIKKDNDVGAVIVGYDKYICMNKVCEAMEYLSDPSVQFIATNMDNRFPIGNGVVAPGTGVIVDTVISAVERQPVVVGKPNKMFLEIAQTTCEIDPTKCLMIGDRLNTDITFGRNCGFKTLCVLTGVTDEKRLNEAERNGDTNLIPDYYADDLTTLFEGIN